MMNEVNRWSCLLAFAALGCVATPGSEGSSATEESQKHGQGASDESELSFVEGLPCSSNVDCGRRSYCKSPDGQCGGSGTCETRPKACTQTHAPVCGCDDNTYANACLAASAGL